MNSQKQRNSLQVQAFYFQGFEVKEKKINSMVEFFTNNKINEVFIMELIKNEWVGFLRITNKTKENLSTPLSWKYPKLKGSYEYEEFNYSYTNIYNNSNVSGGKTIEGFSLLTQRQQNNSPVEGIKIIENAPTLEFIPLGSLLFEFSAACVNDSFQSWVNKYGLKIEKSFAFDMKNKIFLALRSLTYNNSAVNNNTVKELREAGVNDMCELLRNTTVEFSDGDIFYRSNDIFSLIAVEVVELYKMGKEISKCDCGIYYVKRKGQYKNNCPACPPPSKKKGYNLEEKKEYMKLYREKQKALKRQNKGLES